jgi:hypothetical protein
MPLKNDMLLINYLCFDLKCLFISKAAEINVRSNAIIDADNAIIT